VEQLSLCACRSCYNGGPRGMGSVNLRGWVGRGYCSYSRRSFPNRIAGGIAREPQTPVRPANGETGVKSPPLKEPLHRCRRHGARHGSGRPAPWRRNAPWLHQLPRAGPPAGNVSPVPLPSADWARYGRIPAVPRSEIRPVPHR